MAWASVRCKPQAIASQRTAPRRHAPRRTASHVTELLVI